MKTMAPSVVMAGILDTRTASSESWMCLPLFSNAETPDSAIKASVMTSLLRTKLKRSASGLFWRSDIDDSFNTRVEDDADLPPEVEGLKN